MKFVVSTYENLKSDSEVDVENMYYIYKKTIVAH